MDAKLILWRLGKEYRSEEAYERFLHAFARTSMAKLRPYGLLDGFVMRVSETMILTINLYETREQARAAWHEVVSAQSYGAEGGLELLFHVINRVDDLPLLSGEAWPAPTSSDSVPTPPGDE